ncbi:TPA: hypothetical protein ANIA_11599 [Aspergillus nidulans FGSC A4]|uniref:Uncharacterized protein n=1 Tax=Emericella nidulans (strain FGSC A4 / ATCC 38163 / CBS 112.46 / NRRL 194 / M139) TaxID=227321 RepID=C8VDY2_EMENI|nr:TPA: hypothetical protein ANIA_11599 [Aspergillus nidulans FGSC A4]
MQELAPGNILELSSVSSGCGAEPKFI